MKNGSLIGSCLPDIRDSKSIVFELPVLNQQYDQIGKDSYGGAPYCYRCNRDLLGNVSGLLRGNTEMTANEGKENQAGGNKDKINNKEKRDKKTNGNEVGIRSVPYPAILAWVCFCERNR